MRHRILWGCLISVLAAGTLSAQIAGDVIGVHNLGPGSKSPVTGRMNNVCEYCHAPHSGTGKSPLWNQKFSTQTYTPYSSTTYVEKGLSQPPLGGPSSLCLSCHDGTVAPGTTQAYGNITMTGSMLSADVFGTNLSNSHPFSLVLPMTDSIDLVSTLVSQHLTADPTGAVKLINNNVECNSCHNPHVQAKDKISLNFLVRDSSNGQLCLACHDPNRTKTGQVNPLAGWSTSIHATATNKVTSGTGTYSTVALNACISCHSPHEAGRTSASAPRSQRTGLPCLPQWRLEYVSCGPQRICRIRQGRASFPRRHKHARCRRRFPPGHRWACSRASQQ